MDYDPILLTDGMVLNVLTGELKSIGDYIPVINLFHNAGLRNNLSLKEPFFSRCVFNGRGPNALCSRLKRICLPANAPCVLPCADDCECWCLRGNVQAACG